MNFDGSELDDDQRESHREDWLAPVVVIAAYLGIAVIVWGVMS